MNRYWAFLGFFCVTLGYSSAFAGEGTITRDMLLHASLVAGLQLPDCVLNIEGSNNAPEFKAEVPKLVFRAMQLRSEIRDLHAENSTEHDDLREVAEILETQIQNTCFESFIGTPPIELSRGNIEVVTVSDPQTHTISLRMDVVSGLSGFNLDGLIVHSYLELSKDAVEVPSMTWLTMQSLAKSRNHPTNK